MVLELVLNSFSVHCLLEHLDLLDKLGWFALLPFLKQVIWFSKRQEVKVLGAKHFRTFQQVSRDQGTRRDHLHGILKGHIAWNLTVDPRIGCPLVLWSIFNSNSGFGFSIAIIIWPLSLAAGESSISITTPGSWVFLCAVTFTSTSGGGACLAGLAPAALAAAWASFSALSASTFLNSAATLLLSLGSSSKLDSKGTASCSGGSFQRTWASHTSSAISRESVETVNWITCLWQGVVT